MPMILQSLPWRASYQESNEPNASKSKSCSLSNSQLNSKSLLTIDRPWLYQKSCSNLPNTPRIMLDWISTIRSSHDRAASVGSHDRACTLLKRHVHRSKHHALQKSCRRRKKEDRPRPPGPRLAARPPGLGPAPVHVPCWAACSSRPAASPSGLWSKPATPFFFLFLG